MEPKFQIGQKVYAMTKYDCYSVLVVTEIHITDNGIKYLCERFGTHYPVSPIPEEVLTTDKEDVKDYVKREAYKQMHELEKEYLEEVESCKKELQLKLSKIDVNLVF